jgi:hypothetical protein
MSTPAATDIFLVQRGTTQYRVAFDKLSTVADADLLLVQRGTTQHRVSGLDLKAYLAGTPPIPWTPADLPGLYSWHEAWDASTITLSGQNASEWRDKSGAGRHYSQGTTLSQFTYDGAKKCLNRATDGGLMEMANDTANQPTAITLGYLIDTRGGSQDNLVLAKGNAPFGAPGFYVTNQACLFWDGATHQVIDPSSANPAITTTRWGASGGNGYVNGVLSGASATTAAAFTPLAITLARSIGRWTRANPFPADFNGDFYCIIESSQVVSDVDRQRLEGYIAHGAGKTALLPANHPYKNAPPTK